MLGFVILRIQKGGNLGIRISFFRLFLFCSSDFSTMSRFMFLMHGEEYVLRKKKDVTLIAWHNFILNDSFAFLDISPVVYFEVWYC